MSGGTGRAPRPLTGDVDPAEFRAEVTAFCDSLRATKPADPNKPVLVAGDPERRNAALRRQEGIPVGPIKPR